MKTIELSCDDDRVILYSHSNNDIDVEAWVKAALRDMKYDEVVDPVEDWFMVLVQNFCKLTGYHVFSEDVQFDVEELYWQEVQNREEQV